MKTYLIFFFLMFFASNIVLAQNESDVIVTHTGEKLNVNVISVDNDIEYSYPGETVINSIGKYCVKEVDFKSGRKQKITEKIIIDGEKDWEKVIITTNIDDISCLVRIGDIIAGASNTWNFKNKKQVDKTAMIKFKKEAATMGAFMVLLVSDTKSRGNLVSGASSLKNGVAYGYQ